MAHAPVLFGDGQHVGGEIHAEDADLVLPGQVEGAPARPAADVQDPHAGGEGKVVAEFLEQDEKRKTN